MRQCGPMRKCNKPLLQIYTDEAKPLVVYRVLNRDTGMALACTTEESEVRLLVDRFVDLTPVRVDSFALVTFEDVDFGITNGLIHNAGNDCPKTIDYGK